jgi:HEAT repeat protein
VSRHRPLPSRALGRIGPKASAALPALRELLKDEEEAIRDSAKEAVKLISPAGKGEP